MPMWRSTLLTLCILGSTLQAKDWTRFRGPNGSGIGSAKLPAQWTEKDYNWKVKLPGVGHSSPVVWDDRIFLTAGDESIGKRLLVCVHAGDGKQLWTAEFAGPKHRKHRDNSFASSTPVVDGDHVYVTWGSPEDYLVVALTHAGKEVWSENLGPYKAGHGFGASPIVVDDVLIVPNDQDGGSSMVGLDRKSGKLLWRKERAGKSSYITPCVLERNGSNEVIVTNWHHGVTSIDPRTGKTIWEADVFDKGHTETAIGSPIVARELVLATCGWLGVRYETIAVGPPQTGADKPAKVYTIDRIAPLCTTPLVKDDFLILWSDNGTVTCADVRTGKIHWSERLRSGFYSSPVCADNRVYNISRDGEVFVLELGKEYRLLGQNPNGEGSHSTPAISGGRMYLRTFTHLISIGGEK